MTFRPPLLAALAVAAGCAAVVSTYRVFSQTFDEPAHLATGMEWLDRGAYTLEPLHPPVARVMTALGPYLDGARSQGATWVFAEGNRILWAQRSYGRTLALSRLGTLPFLVLGAAVVWVWARRLFGAGAALAAVLLFVTLPPVLAHAGVAATDMGHAATLALALLGATLWLEAPTARRSVLFGVSAGLAAATKFSSGIFLPPVFVAMVVARRLLRRDDAHLQPAPPPRPWARSFALAVAAGAVTLLAAYRFQVAPFVAGLRMLLEHQAAGHDAFLLGRTGDGGWWYFFPVTFAVKTPIPFLALAAAGGWMVWRRGWLTRDWRPVAPLLAALLVLLIGMTSRVTIGLRHILAIYPLLAVPAGFATWRLWTAPVHRVRYAALAGLLVAWQALATVRAHPDHLAWFNAFAGRHPERIVVAGDLDWGQDLLRLADTLRSRKVDTLALAYFGSADPRRLLPVTLRPLAPDERPTGWIAASEAVLKGVGFEPHHGFEWLDSVAPAAHAGRSIRLYYRPPPPAAAPAAPRTP